MIDQARARSQAAQAERQIIMNALNTSFAGPLLGWLMDFYLLATVLLCIYIAARRWIGQPVNRLMMAWTVMFELMVLAVVCALPFWPRISLVRSTSQQATRDLSISRNHVQMIQPNVQLNPVNPVIKNNPVAGNAVKLESPKSNFLSSFFVSHNWTELFAVAYLAGAALVGLWLCWGAATTMWVRRRLGRLQVICRLNCRKSYKTISEFRRVPLLACPAVPCRVCC